MQLTVARLTTPPCSELKSEPVDSICRHRKAQAMLRHLTRRFRRRKTLRALCSIGDNTSTIKKSIALDRDTLNEFLLNAEDETWMLSLQTMVSRLDTATRVLCTGIGKSGTYFNVIRSFENVR